jgi:sugar O-acyltransferase (sialic acid O-acetyltransferase NeuD family)
VTAAHGIVVYGVGSPIVADIEESIWRARLSIAAAVQNVPGEVFLLDRSHLMPVSDVSDDLLPLPFVVPLFTPANRQHAAREARERGFRQPFSLIDPTAVCPRTLDHGPGLYVNAGCQLGAASTFGEFVFINRGASLGHHADLGSFVSIGPGAVLAGLVRLGSGAVIGAGAVVLPKISIGTNAVVGAGSVVTRDVPDHCLVTGNPARIAKEGIAGYDNQSVT